MIRVVIADDQVILRESLKFIIEQDPGIKVVGCAGNGSEALELCDTHKPDIVLMDIIMPGCDGIEGTKQIKARYSDLIKVIILTTFNEDEKVSRALANGADGYILKDVLPEELVTAIKSTARGFGIFDQSAVKTVMKKAEMLTSLTYEKNGLHSDLTERERKIIKMIVAGKTNREIALELNFTEGTVKNIITGILNELKLRDRTQLAVFAIRNNLE